MLQLEGDQNRSSTTEPPLDSHGTSLIDVEHLVAEKHIKYL